LDLAFEELYSNPPKESRAMKQLTFYGKKTVPAAIRKDMWRPFATIAFPVPKSLNFASHKQEDSVAQDVDDELGIPQMKEINIQKLGELAYKKLRELRLLRDYAWRKPDEPIAISKERREGTAEPLEPRLANRRAHKRREAKADAKERREWLMDQRGTSIADLSTAIEQVNDYLLKQTQPLEGVALQRSDKKVREWEKIKELAALASTGEIIRIENELNRWMGNPKKVVKDSRTAKLGPWSLRAERAMLIRAQMAVNIVRSAGIPVELSNPLPKSAGEPSDVENDGNTEMKITTKDHSQLSTQVILPNYSKKFGNVTLNQKWFDLIKAIKRRYDPTFRDSDPWSREDLNERFPIQIFWADLFDRKYTNSWPDNTFHQWIGPRSNRDVYFGAVPPSDHVEGFDISDVERTFLADIKDPNPDELRATDEIKELTELKDRVSQQIEQVGLKMANLKADEWLSKKSQSGPGEEKLEGNSEIQKDVVDINEESAKLETQKEELQSLLQNVQDELDTLEEERNSLKKERQAEITRDIFQGNMGIDDDVIVEEEVEDLDEDEGNLIHEGKN
jgi:Transcriptional regulation of mitochondrial recombination